MTAELHSLPRAGAGGTPPLAPAGEIRSEFTSYLEALAKQGVRPPEEMR